MEPVNPAHDRGSHRSRLNPTRRLLVLPPFIDRPKWVEAIWGDQCRKDLIRNLDRSGFPHSAALQVRRPYERHAGAALCARPAA